MKTYKEFILSLDEARKNPEQNPKVSAYEAMLPYKDDPNAFIHFSDLNKVGINPMSDFEAPVGIYAYPLQQVWEFYNVDKHKSLKHLPFAADRKYIHLLKWNGRGKFVKDFHHDYSKSDLDYDIQKMKTLFEEQIDKTRMEILFNQIRDILVKYRVMIPSTFVLGEPINLGTFLDWSIERLSLNYIVIMKEVLPLQKEYNYTLMDFDTVIDAAIHTTNQKSPAGEFWQISRFLANYGIDPKVKRFYNSLYIVKHDKSNKGLNNSYKNFQRIDDRIITAGSKNWSHLLRDGLGYAGFSDNSGRGIIHKAEPVQTLFLGKEFITQLSTVLNKDYIDSFAIIEHEKHCYEYLEECYKKAKVPFDQEQIKEIDKNYKLAKVVAKILISNLGSAKVHEFLKDYHEAKLDNKQDKFLDNILKTYQVIESTLHYENL